MGQLRSLKAQSDDFPAFQSHRQAEEFCCHGLLSYNGRLGSTFPNKKKTPQKTPRALGSGENTPSPQKKRHKKRPLPELEVVIFTGKTTPVSHVRKPLRSLMEPCKTRESLVRPSRTTLRLASGDAWFRSERLLAFCFCFVGLYFFLGLIVGVLLLLEVHQVVLVAFRVVSSLFRLRLLRSFCCVPSSSLSRPKEMLKYFDFYHYVLDPRTSPSFSENFFTFGVFFCCFWRVLW